MDMAALDFARANRISYGGWVPKDRMNEAGRLSDVYEGLTETRSENVLERTRRNVASGDATLVFVDGSTSKGTEQTVKFARDARKPLLVLDLREGVVLCARQLEAWLLSNSIDVLNIAGPRASEAPGIDTLVTEVLRQNLRLLGN